MNNNNEQRNDRAIYLSSTFEESSYFLADKLFSSEEIDHIRNICEQSERKEGLTGVNKDPNYTIRKSKISWHSKNEELISMLWPHILRVNEKAKWNYNISKILDIQYTVYDDKDSHYDWHVDIMHGSREDNLYRKISCSILLNEDADEYEGGNFELLRFRRDNNMEIRRVVNQKKGSAIFFPSFLYHRITPITKGIRKSLVLWVGGPKWV